jgi:hypothetical protein
MSSKKTTLRSIVVSCTLAGVVAIASPGCSSSTGGNPAIDGGDGTSDTGSDAPLVIHRNDAGNAADSAGMALADAADSAEGAASGFDGTVGKGCQSNADCQPIGGVGVNTCSSSTFANALYPAAVCVLRTCNPGTDGNLHFCDGPDNPASPGVCLNSANGGICLPKCLAAADGSAPTGCQGKDTCALAATAVISSQLVAIGFCLGGCTADTDCPAGNKCQKDQGICLTTVTPPTKALGAPCTTADNGSTTTPAACNCLINQAAMATQGFCTQTCIVGSAAAACPAGYLCDSQEPLQVTDPNTGATLTGFATQNAGISGLCLPTATSCTADAGAGASSGDAGACPANSRCVTTNTAGPDCQP